MERKTIDIALNFLNKENEKERKKINDVKKIGKRIEQWYNQCERFPNLDSLFSAENETQWDTERRKRLWV